MDNLAILFALYAWSIVGDDEQRARPGRFVLSAVVMGLSLATKHFLVLLPLWVLYSPRFGSVRRRVAWVGGSLAILFASFVPYMFEAPSREAIVTHVLGYASYFKMTLFWLPLKALNLYTPTVYWLEAQGLSFLPTSLFIAAVLLTGLAVRRFHLKHRLNVHLLALVVLTPSMGNQYLAWPLVACAVYWRSLWSNLYVLFGTLLLLLSPSALGVRWPEERSGDWVSFTIGYPDVQIWLLGLLIPVWLAWLVGAGHFTTGKRFLKGPFFEEEPGAAKATRTTPKPE
jgi:hypothetical protein